jgi:hypothetical protein
MAAINNLSDDLQILHNLDGWSGFSVLRVVWGGGGGGGGGAHVRRPSGMNDQKIFKPRPVLSEIQFPAIEAMQ